MSRMSVLRLRALGDSPESLMQQMEAMESSIRVAAEQFCQARGGLGGGPFDDWMRAERHVCWLPQAELKETDTAIHLLVGVPGIDPEDMLVTLLPKSVIVMGKNFCDTNGECTVHFSDFGSKKLFRRIDFPVQIHVDSAVVTIEKSMLKLSAAKVEPFVAAAHA